MYYAALCGSRPKERDYRFKGEHGDTRQNKKTCSGQQRKSSRTVRKRLLITRRKSERDPRNSL
eukprot:296076-Pleurochrysis_carterae.AAC.2